MKLSYVYLSAYCEGIKLSNRDLLEALSAYEVACGVLIRLGPAFRITFKEANNCYLWLDGVARARGLKI